MKLLLVPIAWIALPFGLAFAQADIEVQKSVNNRSPMPGEPVEFTIVVNNLGNRAATNVIIRDRLPSEMVIPAGTAAFPSTGVYEPENGAWGIGDLNAGSGATLVIPAMVTATQPPRCIVNSARSEFRDDVDSSNDESRAAIYHNSTDHCVDVSAQTNVFTLNSFIVDCNGSEPYYGTVDLRNAGPDVARDVQVSLTQTPVIGASIRFDDTRCQQTGSGTCLVPEIAAGETLFLSITSDTFQSHNTGSYRLSATVSTSDIDYATENNLFAGDEFVDDFSTCQETPIEFDGSFLAAGGPYCFIATAAYGSPLDPHLDTLRNFRDRYLLTNAPGRAFVSFYYRHSPLLADYIAERDWLRAIVRALLTPLVYALEYPWMALLVVLLTIALLLGRRRRKARAAVPFVA